MAAKVDRKLGVSMDKQSQRMMLQCVMDECEPFNQGFHLCGVVCSEPLSHTNNPQRPSMFPVHIILHTHRCLPVAVSHHQSTSEYPNLLYA